MIAAAIVAFLAAAADVSSKCAHDGELVVCATGGHGAPLVVTTYARAGEKLKSYTVPDRLVPFEVRFEQLFSDRPPQIVVVSGTYTRNNVEHVFTRDLDLIGELGSYWGFIAADLDGDGVKEIIDSGCCAPRPCAMGILIGLDRFDGKKYKEAASYLDFHEFRPGDRNEWTLALPKGKTKFRLHAVPIGTARGTLRLDGEKVARVTGTTDVPISTDSDCPSMTATVAGPEGSAVWVFIADR